jgi:hypothetical protein
MAQIEFPIEMVGVAYLCDECGAEMTADGPMNWTVPATYPHACPNGHKATLLNSYPNTGWRRVAAGCTCPVMDNGHGRGAWTNDKGDAVFWRNGDCPLHGAPAGPVEKDTSCTS